VKQFVCTALRMSFFLEALSVTKQITSDSSNLVLHINQIWKWAGISRCKYGFATTIGACSLLSLQNFASITRGQIDLSLETQNRVQHNILLLLVHHLLPRGFSLRSSLHRLFSLVGSFPKFQAYSFLLCFRLPVYNPVSSRSTTTIIQ